MNESDVLELLRAVEAQDGRPDREWAIRKVDDLGWACAAIGVRSNGAYAVTPTGRIGSYVISMTRDRDALARLAALPEPGRTRIEDREAAQSLLESALVRMMDPVPRQWREVEVGDLGWLFATAGLDTALRFVVTRLGQVAVCPSDDLTGEETMRALIERATTRIPVAQLSP
ncbi:MAG: hypothetical protein IPJ15_08405 [Actinomycetales bacterium]|nr:hypothetical protein [Candidatus Phosphoribacter baldrii]